MYYNFFYVPTITCEKEGKRAFRVDIFENTKPDKEKKIGFLKWFSFKFDIFKGYEYKGRQWIGVASVILGANDEVLYYTVISKYEQTNPQGSSIYDESQFLKEGSTFPHGLNSEKQAIIQVCKEYSESWG